MDQRLFSQLGRAIVTATIFRKFCSAIILLWVVFGLAACGGFLPKSSSNRHNQPLQSSVVSGLKMMGSSPGEAMMIRIFKQEQTLEVWKRTSAGKFKLFKSYEICAFSGDLGPKMKEGDRQSPEGFYTITPGLMNPKSGYYLAFNTGFPNKFDRSNGRTGSQLMVHGDCSSRGCYAMTDNGIAEIYALARESFKGGNSSFQLQIFPFKMTSANLAKQSTSPHLAFWKDIKEGYDLFEIDKQPPAWDVCERQYVFNASGNGALNPMGACPPVTRSAALVAKQLADEKAVADSLAYAERQQAEEAALKERSEAVNGAVNGAVSNLFGGLGSLFGGEDVTPVMSGKAAPVPRAPLSR
jgi:murein L,D-transpeptidase YafK